MNSIRRVRTSPNIGDDVPESGRARARRERPTAGKVQSDLVRAELTRRQPAVRTRNGFPVIESRGAVVTNELVRSIRDKVGD